MTIKEKVLLAAKALNDKKAEDVSAVEINDLSVITDFMVFATATSSTHIRALGDAVEKAFSDLGIEPHHREGKSTGWILIDYTDFIVHIFTRKEKDYYNLDRLWADGKAVDLSEVLSEGTDK